MNFFSSAHALAIAGLLFSPVAVKAKEVVTLIGGEWRPYISETLPHYGPVARLVTEAFALEGVEVKYVFRPWNRAYAEAAKDMAHGSLVWSMSGKDTDRRRRFHQSEVLFESQSVFFHRKGYPFRWRGEDSLAGVRMGGTAGYEYAFDKSPRLTMDRSATTDSLNFQKLLAGRFDVFPANLDIGLWIMRTELSPEQASLLTWGRDPYNIAHYHLLLNKKNAANVRYMALFNSGLKRMRDSGKLALYLRGIVQVPSP